MKVTRGIRQGCSFSGMIYALSIEPMLHNIHSGLRDFDLTCSDMHFSSGTLKLKHNGLPSGTTAKRLTYHWDPEYSNPTDATAARVRELKRA